MVIAGGHLRSCARVSCASVVIPDLRSVLRSAAGYGRGSQTFNKGLEADWPPRPRRAMDCLVGQGADVASEAQKGSEDGLPPICL
jgi:hypothetical protein